MKRFFRNLKTLAMAAVVGVASLAVSCSEPYDDTQIKADIADLQSRVEALEIKLTQEVNVLKALIDAEVAELNGAIDDAIAGANDAIAAVEAKIAILDYEQNADGSWTLTTKDGETINIYPKFEENNEGLLTVIEENGVYYWAQIKDGQAVALVDADGNKYAAHHATVVPEFPTIPECEYVAPIVTETKNEDGTTNYQVSFDGGNKYYPLGGAGDVIINETTQCDCVTLFEDVELSKDGKSLTLTLNGGRTFTTTLPEEFKFGVNSGKLFFQAEETKEVALVLEGVKEFEVIAKPEGWKAVANGKKLSVTAPAAETGDEAGVVRVLAITSENRAAFAKLNVSAGKGYRVEIREVEVPVLDDMGEPVLDKEGNAKVEIVEKVVVVNEMVTELDDYGTIYTIHPALYFSMLPKAEFDEMGGAQGVVDAISNYGYPYMYQTTDRAQFNPEKPAYELEMTFEELWVSLYGEPMEIEAGVEYVIWATTFTAGATFWDPNVLHPEEMVYTTYVKRSIEVEEVKATAFDITIDVNVSGYSAGYRVLFGALEYMTGWEKNEFAYWQKGWGEFGFVRTDATFSGSLFDFGYDVNSWDEKEEGLPSTDYLLLILPLEEGKEAADYTVDDVQEYIFSTADLEKGGTITPTITAAEIGYNNVKGQFDAKGAVLVYYQYYRAAAWKDAMEAWDNEAWVTALLDGGNVKKADSFTYNLSAINMGETIRFAAVAVDKDGKYGEVTIEKFTSKDFEFKEGFSAAITLADADGGKAKVVTPTTTGGEAVKYRYQLISSEWTWNGTYGGNYESAGKYLATQTNTYNFKEVAVADLVDGAFTVSGLTFGATYWLVVVPVDAEGNFGSPAGAEFTPVMAGDIVCADEANYEVGKPTLELVSVVCNYTDSSDEEWSEYTLKVKLTPSADADVTYIARFDEEYEDSYPSEWSLMQYVVNRYSPNYTAEHLTYGYTLAFEGTEPVELQLYGNDWGGSSIYYTHYIYITWKKTIDGVDWYRECWKINVREFAGLPTAPAAGEGGEEGGDGGAVVAPL